MLLSVENAVAVERVGAKAAIDMFVEAGFTGMDYSFFNGGEAWEKAFGGPDALKKAEEIRVYAKEQGLALSQSHAPFKFRFGMEMSENEYEFYRIVRSMEIAAAMEIPAIVAVRSTTPVCSTTMNVITMRCSLMQSASASGSPLKT